jgi:hypothetical protein
VEKNKAKLEQKIKKVLYIDQQIQQDNQETNQQEITKRLTLIC